MGWSPYINQLKEVYEDTESVHLVYELCSQGEVPVFLAEKTSVSNRDLATIWQQLITVIADCHERGTS